MQKTLGGKTVPGDPGLYQEIKSHYHYNPSQEEWAHCVFSSVQFSSVAQLCLFATP